MTKPTLTEAIQKVSEWPSIWREGYIHVARRDEQYLEVLLAVASSVLDPDDRTVERVARGVRRNKLVRTRRLSIASNPDLDLTESEIDDARAALAAIVETPDHD